MYLLPALQALAGRATAQATHLGTVEATKNALVLPFFQALGYDVFDPAQFIPDPGPECGFTEKVQPDYLVLKDGSPILIVECRQAGEELGEVAATRINWCFEATEARVAVLTNGLRYAFFTDLVHPGHMDEKPILEVDIHHLEAYAVDRLFAFTSEAFNREAIQKGASDISHYLPRILSHVEAQMDNPSSELVRCFQETIYHGPVTPIVKTQFAELVKVAFQRVVKERIRERLLLALEMEGPAETRLTEVERIMAPSQVIPVAPAPFHNGDDPSVSLEQDTLKTEPEWDTTSGHAPKAGWVLGALLVVVALAGALLYGVPKWKKPLPTPPVSGTLVQGPTSPLPTVPIQAAPELQPVVPQPSLVPTPNPSPSNPAPTPTPSSTEVSLSALMDKGDFAGAAEYGIHKGASLPKEHVVLRLAIASETQTVKNLLSALPGREKDLFLMPIRMKDGRTCYQVFMGAFPNETAAKEAAAALPEQFQGRGKSPMLFKARELPSRQ